MAEVTLSISADEAKAIQAFRRLEDREGALSQKRKQLADKEKALSDEVYRKKLKQATDISERDRQDMTLRMERRRKLARLEEEMGGRSKSLTEQSTAAVKGMIAQVLVLGTATRAVAGAWEDMSRAIEKGARGIKASANARQQLLQIAKDPADMSRMVGAANKSAIDYGLDRETAMRLQFNLESSGMAQDRDLFASLSRLGLDPAGAAGQVKTVSSAFGAQEAGSNRAIVNKLLAGSANSKVSFDQFAPAVSTYAGSAATAGASDEESIAALSIAADSKRSPEIAATQLRAFMDFANKSGLSGGFASIVQQIQGKGMNDQKLAGYFGSTEALDAFRVLRDKLPQLQAETSRLQGIDRQGPGADVLSRGMAAFQSNATLVAEERGRRETVRGEIDMEQRGRAGLEIDAIRERLENASQMHGEHWLRRKVRGIEISGMQLAGSSPEDILRTYAEGTDGAPSATQFVGTEARNMMTEMQVDSGAINANTQALNRVASELGSTRHLDRSGGAPL